MRFFCLLFFTAFFWCCSDDTEDERPATDVLGDNDTVEESSDALEDIDIDDMLGDANDAQDLLIDGSFEEPDSFADQCDGNCEVEVVTLAAGSTSLEITIDQLEETQCRFRLNEMARQSSEPVAIPLQGSPFWQVDLRRVSNLFTESALEALWVPSLETIRTGELDYDCDQLSFSECEGEHCQLNWHDLEVDEQQLTVSVFIDIREDGMVLWDIDVSLTDGELFINAVRFPVFALPGLGDDSHDDLLLLSWDGGYLFPDVLGHDNGLVHPNLGPMWDADNDRAQNDQGQYWVHGTKLSNIQMVAYLDGEGRQEAGFYFAVEDPNGYRKKIYANRAAPDGRFARFMVFYATHFNAIRHEEHMPLQEDLQHFHLFDRFGYRPVTRPFRGDWMTAAGIYRDFVTNDPTITEQTWLRRGTLRQREIEVSPISFLYQTTEPLSSEDQTTVLDVVSFFRENTPDLPIALMSTNPATEFTIPAYDSCFTELSESAYDIARVVYEETGGIWMFNHDTGMSMLHIDGEPEWGADYATSFHCEGSDEATWLENAEIRQSLIRNIDGTYYVQRTHGPQLAAHGQWWIDNRIQAFAERRYMESKDESNVFALHGAMLSGTFPVSTACWAPLHPDIDLERHDHPAGGGNHHFQSVRETYLDLENFAAGTTPENPTTIDRYVLMLERNSELFLDFVVATHDQIVRPTDFLALRAGSNPYTAPADAIRVPLYGAIYRDYVPRGSGFLFPSFVASIYEPAGEDGHNQFQFAIAHVMVTLGHFIATVISPDFLNSLPSTTGPWRDAYIYLRDLSDILYANQDYFGWGSIMRPPELTSSTHPLVMCERPDGSCTTLEHFVTRELPAVTSAAFSTLDASIGVFVTNWSDVQQSFELSLLSEYGLSDGTSICLYHPDTPDEQITVVADSIATVSTTLPARSVVFYYSSELNCDP